MICLPPFAAAVVPPRVEVSTHATAVRVRPNAEGLSAQFDPYMGVVSRDKSGFTQPMYTHMSFV